MTSDNHAWRRSRCAPWWSTSRAMSAAACADPAPTRTGRSSATSWRSAPVCAPRGLPTASGRVAARARSSRSSACGSSPAAASAARWSSCSRRSPGLASATSVSAAASARSLEGSRARKIPHARRGPVKDPALALRRAGRGLAGSSSPCGSSCAAGRLTAQCVGDVLDGLSLTRTSASPAWAATTMSVTLSSPMPLGSTIATWAGLMKTSPSASWRPLCGSSAYPGRDGCPRRRRTRPSWTWEVMNRARTWSAAERRLLLEVARIRAELGAGRSAARTDSAPCALAGSDRAAAGRETFAPGGDPETAVLSDFVAAERAAGPTSSTPGAVVRCRSNDDPG